MESRRPLHALPLACFLPPDNASDPRASPYKSATKRSRSPSILLTPAKRRILREEGYFASPSTTTSRKGGDRARVLARDAGCCTPSRAASPMMLGKDTICGDNVSSFRDAMSRDTRSATSSFSSATPSRVLRSSTKPSLMCSTIDTDAPSTSRRAMTPLMVPRELPRPPDPQSRHYPGFDVHYDTHIELPSSSSRADAELKTDLDKEATKENMPPRKKVKKTVSLPDEDSATALFDERIDVKPKAASYPATPYHNSLIPTPTTPHHHRAPSSNMKIAREFTPGRASIESGDTLARKRALEQEVDDVDSDEEDL